MTQVQMKWVGNGMVPVRQNLPMLNDELKNGHWYVVEIREVRSAASHNHYFASLTDMWRNLPERFDRYFPSMEHLRARALIETGWYDETIFAMANNDEAIKLASQQKGENSFKAVSINENVVVIRTPKSQSAKAMGKQDFQKSKDDVLTWVSDLLAPQHREAAE